MQQQVLPTSTTLNTPNSITTTNTEHQQQSNSLADALEDAQQRVASLLQHPDDLLTKVPQLLAKFTRDKQAMDALLKSSVQQLLDDTADGLGRLARAQTGLISTRTHLAAVDQQCAAQNVDGLNVSHRYQRIQKVSRTYQNFAATKEVVDRFQKLNADLERVSALLDADMKQSAVSDAPNLLLIHYELFQLEEFRDQTVQRARKQGPGVVQIVTRYFKRLDALVERWRRYLGQLSRNLVQLVHANQGSVVVRLMKIIEVEEREDERVLMAQQMSANLQRRASPVDEDHGLHSTSPTTTTTTTVPAENPRTIKNYRTEFFNAIHDAIHETMAQRMAGHESDITTALQHVQFVFDELATVHDEIEPRCPPKYKVFNFYVLQYHKLVYDLLARLTKRNMETRDILAVTSWVRDYYRVMQDRLQISEELLEPRLLDDNEEVLIQDYVKLLRKKLMEWVDRLLTTEKHDFVQRDRPPETESEQYYCTSGSVIVFQMVNQQIDIAIHATHGGKLLLDVTQECLQVLRYFQQQQLKMLEDEEQRFNQSGDSFPGGFPEYVMALCNNHLKCTEFMETLQKRLEEAMDDKYRADCSRFLKETLDGFMRVSRRGYQCLIHVVFHDLQPAYQQLFTQPWYDQPGQLMSAIVRTLEDYFEDFKKHLQDYLFTKFTTDLLDRFLLAYLEAMRGKYAKFKMPACKALLRQDMALAEAFWVQHKAAKRVKQSFDLLDKVVTLLETSDTMLFLSWYSLAKSYHDVPLTFVEEVLSKRDDLDKATVKECMANCRSKAKEGPIVDAQASLFSKSTGKSDKTT